MSDHKIVHVEFAAKEPEVSAKFYSDVFGWEIQEMSEMNYIMFDIDGDLGGGFPEIDGETTNAGDVIVYIDTDDIPSTLDKIEAAGGKTLMPETEIPETGWFAFFEDPAGNRVGIYKGLSEG
jgi:predicted enzyme related to lactoylglutathione lyase